MHDDRGSTIRDIGGQATLANMLRTARCALGLSYGQLAEATGISKTALHKLEQGLIRQPRQIQLPPLARTLDIPLADLYAAAGYDQPTTLPTFAPYLRSRYKGMPTEAQAELAEAFERIAAKHGYDPDARGPAPGEDETDDHSLSGR